MSEPVLEALRLLVGQPCWGATICVGMLMLQFGPPRTSLSPRGRLRETGDWALHIQCDRSVTDRGEEVDDVEDFLAHERLVSGVVLHSDGALELQLAGDVLVRTQPLPDLSGEDWRLFRPGLPEEPHYVWELGRCFEYD